MLNNEWCRWQGKGKCSLTMKDMKPGTRESIFTTEFTEDTEVKT